MASKKQPAGARGRELLLPYDLADVVPSSVKFDSDSSALLRAKGLSEETIGRLAQLCGEYKAVPPERQRYASKTEKVKYFSAVAAHAIALRQLIEHAPVTMHWMLLSKLLDTGALTLGERPAGDGIEAMPLDGDGRTLAMLTRWAEAADSERRRVESESGGGRPNITAFWSGFVAHIAYQVKGDKIRPSAAERSKFVAICSCCFKAAGRQADSMASIAMFVDGIKRDPERFAQHAYWG